jgi:hypothetical protein
MIKEINMPTNEDDKLLDKEEKPQQAENASEHDHSG